MKFKRQKYRRTYYCPREYIHYDPVTGKTLTSPAGYPSDGATCVIDIFSYYWLVHDFGYDRGTWDDGTIISRRELSRCLSQILYKEGRRIRSRYCKWGTFAFGPKVGVRGERKAYPERAGMIIYGPITKQED